MALCNNFSFGIDLDFSNGISVIIIMEYKVPQFAIFQNSRTRQSSIWVGQQGRWVDAQESEFEALWTLAQIIRNSKNVTEVMEQLVNQARQIKKSGEFDSIETAQDLLDKSGLPPIPGFFVPPEELDGLDDETPEDEK